VGQQRPTQQQGREIPTQHCWQKTRLLCRNNRPRPRSRTNSDNIPQEVLNSLTPQQCWYLLQGQDALSQADTTTSTAHQNERTVGAGTTNTETASMVSGISQNMLPSGVPSPTMTGTHW